MIVEERIYRMQPGKVGEFLERYETECLETQARVLGNLIGWFHTDIGPLNTMVHMWGYDSFEERDRRRAELGRDKAWVSSVQSLAGLVHEEKSRILIPAPFSPIR